MEFKDCKRRAALLELAFNKFKPRFVVATAKRLDLNAANLTGITINPAILYAVATSYYFDIKRAKDFHDTTLANGYRQAAFIIKWLLRFRPINDTNADGRFLLVNEKFALALAFALLGIDPASVDKPLYAHLLYSLRYRVMDEGALIAVFMAIKPHSTE